jgi:peptidyl-prolyl cis-trans isomerase C
MYMSQAVKKSLVVSMIPLTLSACTLSSSRVAPTPSAAQLTPAAQSAVQDPAKVVARVNDMVITRGDLERAKKIVLANKPGLAIPPLLYKEFETQTLNQLIGTELLYQASQKLELKDLDQRVKEKMAQIRKGFPRPEDYQRELNKIGMDEKALTESTRRDLAVAYLINTGIAANVKVSEDEVARFFRENPDKFKQPELVRASHILIAVDGKATPAEKKAAKEKAEKLRRELADGADFAKLAREFSACPSGKQGGDLGLFGKGRMDPGFEEAAFALKPGELSQVVESRFGYHVIKLVERKSPEEIPLAAARQRIEDYLKMQKTNSAVEAFVGAARNKAKIELL